MSRPLIKGRLSDREARWKAAFWRSHPRLNETTLDLLIYENRRSIGCGAGPVLWTREEGAKPLPGKEHRASRRHR